MQAFSPIKTIRSSISNNLLILTFLSLLFPSLNALASFDDLTFTGFYTLDMTRADQDTPVLGNAQPSLNTDSTGINFNNSLIGAKINYQLSDSLSLSVLGDISVDNEDQISTNVTWAYLNYDIGDDFTARLGQFQTPLLQGTELRTIGITRIWARPIIPGSGSSGFNEFYGVDLIKKKSFSDHHWIFQVGLGQPEHGVEEVDGKSLMFGSAKYQYQDFSLRTAYVNINYDLSTRTGRLISDEGTLDLLSIESEYSMGHITLHAGASVGDSNATPDDSMAYLSISYPMNSFTPYVFISQREQTIKPLDTAQNDSVESEMPPMGQPGGQPPPPPPTMPVEQEDNRVESPAPPLNSDEVSWAVGAKWTWDESTVIKAQFETVNKDLYETSGAMDNTITGNVITLTLEGIF